MRSRILFEQDAEQGAGHVRAEAVHVVAHRGQRRVGQPAQLGVVPGQQGHVGRDAQAHLRRHRQPGHRHDVVVVDDRRGPLRRGRGQQRPRGPRPRLAGEVGRHLPRTGQLKAPCRRVEGGRADRCVAEGRRAADPGDPPVPERRQIAHGLGDRGGVVGPHGGEPAGQRRVSHGDHGQPDPPRHGRAGIVGAEVDQDRARDLPRLPPRLQQARLLPRLAYQPQQQRAGVLGQDALHPRYELHVEGFEPEQPGRPADGEPDHVHA